MWGLDLAQPKQYSREGPCSSAQCTQELSLLHSSPPGRDGESQAGGGPCRHGLFLLLRLLFGGLFSSLVPTLLPRQSAQTPEQWERGEQKPLSRSLCPWEEEPDGICGGRLALGWALH